MANTRNIIVGAAQIWLSANVKTDGSAAQPYPSLGADRASEAAALANTANWRDVGFTSEGLELSYEPDFGEITVDQLLDAAVLFKKSQKVMIKTSFAEASLENLFVVLNQTGGLTGTFPTQELELQGGSLGDFPVERSLVAAGPGPRPTSGGAERIYYASRVMSIETSAHGLKREEGTFFPVSFRLLPVASTSNAYGKIVDRTF